MDDIIKVLMPTTPPPPPSKKKKKKKKKKRSKILIAFNDMLSNKKLQPIVTEFFITGRKLNISIVFIKQSYFAAPKNIRLDSTHYFIMKIPNKKEL